MKKNIEVYESELSGFWTGDDYRYCIDDDTIDHIADRWEGKCIRITIEELEVKE